MTSQEETAVRVVAESMRSCGAMLPSTSRVGRSFIAGAKRLLAAEKEGIDRNPETQRRVVSRRAADWDERDEARRAWRRRAMAARESLLLQVLGGDRLIPRELRVRLDTELGWPPEKDEICVVFESDLRYLLGRMVRTGQLQREPEPFRGKMRYRYSRKRALEGPIVDLERAYHEDDEAAA